MIKFYRTHLNSWWLRVFPFIILPALIFSAKYLHDPGGFEKSTEILFGSIFTVILAAHGQLFANASKQESAATEFWENKAHGYLWLLRCIETLIHRKRSYLVEERPLNRDDYKKRCIINNLIVLKEFYTRYSANPGTHLIKTVYFEPDPTRCFLKPIYWYYDNIETSRPHSVDDEARQKILFDKNTGMTIAAHAWRDGELKVAETPAEIHYDYHQQRDTVKSIIAYPLFDGAIQEGNFVGLITITSNEEGFFKNSERESYEQVIRQSAIRILMEHTVLKLAAKS